MGKDKRISHLYRTLTRNGAAGQEVALGKSGVRQVALTA